MLPEKDKCYGCGVCVNVCATDACKMVSDAEGFLYPKINYNKCVACNMCEKYCPSLLNEATLFNRSSSKSWCGHFTNEEKNICCASGGAATAISEAVIRRGGVVYGVAYSKDFRSTLHIRVSDLNKLKLLQGSKYVQSNKQQVYKQVKNDLITMKSVLYIGTPCEVAALNSYLGEKHTNLITVELICQGIMSPEIQKQFVENLEKKMQSKVCWFSARYKNPDWAPAYIKAVFLNKKEFCKLAHYTDYGIAHSVFYRPCCYNCQFKNNKSGADFTIGDCWGLPTDDKNWHRYGVSVIITHNIKADEFLDNLQGFSMKEIDYDSLVEKNNPYLRKAILKSKKRDRFSTLLQNRGLHDAAKSVLSLKRKIKGIIYSVYPSILDR